MTKQHFYVITGGPGVGKTTLLEALARLGYATVSEVAREIIKEQMTHQGDALPWKDKVAYTHLMIERSVADYEAAVRAHAGQTLFFDRGLLDAYCYAAMIGMPLTEELERLAAACRYADPVFLLPPWEAIYTTDSERKQDWEEALRTYHTMKKTYAAYGYRVVEVPCAEVGVRVQFVLEHLKKEKQITNQTTDKTI